MDGSRARLAFVAFALILTLLWFVSTPGDSWAGGFWRVRNALVLYTGLMAIGLMSTAVILAARPVQFERLLGGMDKFYRLHKWLGVGGALFAIAHWLAETLPRAMVRRGWITRPSRPPVGDAGSMSAAGFDPFTDLHDVAAEVAGLAYLLLLVLVVLALWRKFPYRHFFRVHRLLAPVYLVLVFHSAILLGPEYWRSPIGPAMGILMAGGSIAAAISIFHRIGRARQAVGSIEMLERYEDNAVLDVVVRLTTAWPGHRAGQFAFVNFGGMEGAHPFTIASAWHRDGRLAFSIKGLGDYTRSLPEHLFPGQSVTIEGPYGRFDFRGARERQIWIGGGIGITPFIAGLQQLIDEGRKGPVDLFYSTRAPSEPFIRNIRELAHRAGVGFHLTVEQRDGFLTFDLVETTVPEWKEADIWFCGPVRFADAIRVPAMRRGLPPSQFHQELFEMR